jgi:hypothetical protein
MEIRNYLKDGVLLVIEHHCNRSDWCRLIAHLLLNTVPFSNVNLNFERFLLGLHIYFFNQKVVKLRDLTVYLVSKIPSVVLLINGYFILISYNTSSYDLELSQTLYSVNLVDIFSLIIYFQFHPLFFL